VFFSHVITSTNVVYELVNENKHPKPKWSKQWVLKTFVEKIVVSEKPYKKIVGRHPSLL